eukprot:ANDGO_05232.mRNA.1 hypothetical protein
MGCGASKSGIHGNLASVPVSPERANDGITAGASRPKVSKKLHDYLLMASMRSSCRLVPQLPRREGTLSVEMRNNTAFRLFLHVEYRKIAIVSCSRSRRAGNVSSRSPPAVGPCCGGVYEHDDSCSNATECQGGGASTFDDVSGRSLQNSVAFCSAEVPPNVLNHTTLAGQKFKCPAGVFIDEVYAFEERDVVDVFEVLPDSTQTFDMYGLRLGCIRVVCGHLSAVVMAESIRTKSLRLSVQMPDHIQKAFIANTFDPSQPHAKHRDDTDMPELAAEPHSLRSNLKSNLDSLWIQQSDIYASGSICVVDGSGLSRPTTERSVDQETSYSFCSISSRASAANSTSSTDLLHPSQERGMFDESVIVRTRSISVDSSYAEVPPALDSSNSKAAAFNIVQPFCVTVFLPTAEVSDPDFLFFWKGATPVKLCGMCIASALLGCCSTATTPGAVTSCTSYADFTALDGLGVD